MTNTRIRNSWFERHSRTALVVLVVFGMTLMLFLAELAARNFMPEWIPDRAERVNFWVYDELLGWSHRPGQHGEFNHRDFSVAVSINSHGLRDTEYSFQRNDKKRMLVLGDSFGWAFGVEHSERFSEILEENHSDWEIINASVSGYGTDQQYLYLRERGLSYKPDVILLLFCDNDFENNLNSEQYWHYKPIFRLDQGGLHLQNVPIPQPTLYQKSKKFIFGETYLIRQIYIKTIILCYKTNKLLSSAIDHLLGPQNPENYKSDKPDKELESSSEFEVTHRLIKAINKLSKESRATLIIVSTPMNKEKREFMRVLSAKEGIAYYPLDNVFSDDKSKSTFPHDRHWNATGHAIAANAINQFLLSSGVF